MPSASSILRIGNAQGFWGDSGDAAATLVRQAPDLDYLTMDYLAEVSMSILAKQRQRDAAAGFARDFIEVVRSLAAVWKSRRKLRLVTNAGGLNPGGCARAAADVLRDAGCLGIRIGVVAGDDVLSLVRDGGDDYAHLETGRPIGDLAERLVTANAYLGADGVARALAGGADLVITGRVADPSLTVGPCLHHFGWRGNDFDRVAGATVAGHLIECGVQVTGGISTDWMTVPLPEQIGFPIVEIAADGSCVVTKPQHTGGVVDRGTVSEQLVYELGDPAHYLSPDATVDFTRLELAENGEDRIRVAGARGGPPPKTYKVSATYRAGYRAAGTLVIVGPDAEEKARRCGQIVLDRLAAAGSTPQQHRVECLGAGAAMPGVAHVEPVEVVLRIAVADERREVVERFSREMTPLITAGPPGTTGYADGRPVVREQFGYWPTLIDRERVRTEVSVVEV